MLSQMIAGIHPSKFATKTVLFLCTANYYRSRFSEYLFNALAKKNGLPWQATSRGLLASTQWNIGPISEFTVERLTALGVPFDAKRFPMQVSEPDFQDADLVVAVKEAEHRAMMRELFPVWENRIEYWDVDDLDCAAAHQALPTCQSPTGPWATILPATVAPMRPMIAGRGHTDHPSPRDFQPSFWIVRNAPRSNNNYVWKRQVFQALFPLSFDYN
jgi:protein-tyrosine phosphatase